MKVRCIDNELIIYGQLSVGEVYEVQGENLLRYYLTDDLGRDIFFNKERFEIVEEDNKMQEKTFREVIATIKEGEVWVSDTAPISFISLREYGALDFNENVGVNLKCKYKLQRKEYTFEEAFKAYEEGKEIESLVSDLELRKIEVGVEYRFKAVNEKWELLENDDAVLTINEIRGKWYINN